MPGPYEYVYDRAEQERLLYPERFAASLAEDRQLFGDILGDTLAAVEFEPKTSGDTTVLIPACGYCTEAPVVAERLGGPDGQSRVHIIGIDEEERAIAVARAEDAEGQHTFIYRRRCP